MIIDELKKGTKYYSVFIPYNHNHQIGTVVIDTARTTGMSPTVVITDLQTEINSLTCCLKYFVAKADLKYKI